MADLRQGLGAHSERGARSYHGGLKAEPPCSGVQGQSPSSGIRGTKPMKLNAFWRYHNPGVGQLVIKFVFAKQKISSDVWGPLPQWSP